MDKTPTGSTATPPAIEPPAVRNDLFDEIAVGDSAAIRRGLQADDMRPPPPHTGLKARHAPRLPDLPSPSQDR